jgi:PhnB protein
MPMAKSKKRKPARKAAKRPTPAKKKVVPIPAGYHTLTPHLVCRGAAEAIAFYIKAFGASEKIRMDRPDGRIMHAELAIGDSIVMLGDEVPEMGATAPPTIGGTASGLLVYVKDVDQAFTRAVGAGATADMPPQDMFWGDRFARLTDPFGHRWSLATHIEDVSPREMARRMQAELARQSASQ